MHLKGFVLGLLIVSINCADLLAADGICITSNITTCEEGYLSTERNVKSTELDIDYTTNTSIGWPLMTRALWRMFLGVTTNVVSDRVIDYYKGNVENNAQRITNHFEENVYDSQARSEADHIISEWRQFKSGNRARRHLSKCPVCNHIAKALARGTPLYCYVPNLR